MTGLEIGALVSALCLTALAIMLFLAWRAPLGFESDERGFVEGDEHADEQNLGI